MRIDSLIMIAGILVTLLPFLGFPLAIDNIILIALGVIVIALGIVVRRRGLVRRSTLKSHGTFVESVPREMNEAHAE